MKKLFIASLIAFSAPIFGADIIQETYVAKYLGPTSKSVWTDRGSNGQKVTTYSDGTVVTASYLDGYLNGPTTTSFPHSKVPQSRVMFENNVRVGNTIYYPSGNPQREEALSAKSQTKVSKWYVDGVPQSIEKYNGQSLDSGEYFTRTGERESYIIDGNGIRPHRDAYGQLSSRDTFSSGSLVRRESLFANGEPSMVVNYSGGQIHGEVRTYEMGGTPLAVERWSRGYKQGTTLLFQNGAKVSEIPYVAGKKHGIERHYQDNSKVVEEISWKEGKKHGLCRMYIDGAVHEQWYLEDKRVNKLAYDFIYAKHQ